LPRDLAAGFAAATSGDGH